jgi:hypothetical protein
MKLSMSWPERRAVEVVAVAVGQARGHVIENLVYPGKKGTKTLSS